MASGALFYPIPHEVSEKSRIFAVINRGMTDKVYKLSLEQLNDIVSDAVTNAIKKLDNIEIVENEAQRLTKTKRPST